MNRKIATIAIILAFVGGMFFAGVPVEAKKGGGGSIIDEVLAAIAGLDTRVSELESTVTLDSLECIENQVAKYDGEDWVCASDEVDGPQMESIEIFGYDMTDGDVLIMHDGFCTSGGIIGDTVDPCKDITEYDGQAGNGLITGERYALYVQNQSVNDVTIVEILLAGAEYNYDIPGAVNVEGYTSIAGGTPDDGKYFIVTRGDIADDTPAFLKSSPQATLLPGEEVSLIFSIQDDVPIGRDVQLKLTTANGAVFVTTLIAGSQSG